VGALAAFGPTGRARSLPVTVARGRLITIEGIDGAGKTTLAQGLAAAIGARGIEVVVLREPGGVLVSERIRGLVTDVELEIGARAEALLYAASRAQLVEERILPALEAGLTVLLDRFVDSSLAYQGAGRGLGVAAVRAVNDFATGGLEPDRTLLVVVEPALGRARRERAGGAADRLEREGDEFFARIDAGYRVLAAADPARIRVLDGTLAKAELVAAALEALEGVVVASAAAVVEADDDRVDESERESFPASDPPSTWAGPDPG
jgi:dTMP kinase